ncbi:MAG: hypothetical protein KAU95_01885, partial [Candidatus Aenigmarchaeota archaeon]|nr:hypothetical protein [Candidatus Aenigmarchaeota archaeon]
SNISVSPAEDYWGANFSFSVIANDTDGDNISVSLLVFYNSEWRNKGQENVTPGSTVYFNLTSDKYWVGENKYKFEYFDIDNGTPVRAPANSSEYNFSVKKHNISIEYVYGNNTIVSASDTTSKQAIVNLTDDILNTSNNLEMISCYLYVEEEGVYHWRGTESPNTSGYCWFNLFEKYNNYSIGHHNWKITAGSSYYEEGSSEIYNITIADNINATISLIPVAGVLYRFNNSEINWTISNIRELSNPDNSIENVNYEIKWNNEINETGVTNGTSGIFEIPANNSVGINTFKIILSKEGYLNFTYSENYSVYGNLSITVTKNKTLVFKDYGAGIVEENKVNFTANITDELGNFISASVDFNIPEGECLGGIKNEITGIYTCIYHPIDNATPEENNWWVSAVKEYYLNVTSGKDTIFIGDEIDANLTLLPGNETYLYRFNNSNTISYNVTTFYKYGTLVETNLSVLWNDEIKQQLNNSQNFTNNFTIPSNSTVGINNFTILITRGDHKNLTDAKSYSVYGNLSVEILEGGNATVFKNGGENLTALLKINVSDELNNSISNATINFNLPTGSCEGGVENEGNGVYNCTYKPSSESSVGEYNWSANATKQYHINGISENKNLTIKDVLEIHLTSNITAYRNLSTLLSAKLLDGGGNLAELTGYNCSWYIDSSP